MKKMTLRLCALIMCIIPFFVFTACKGNGEIENSSASSQSEEYTPIKDLLSAIKKNPTEYNDKKVSIKGTILKEEGKTVLLDYHQNISSETGEVTGSDLLFGVQQRYEAKSKPSIEVVLLDNIQSYVVESWDYVE